MHIYTIVIHNSARSRDKGLIWIHAGVTGNPIRAYTDPGGSDPLAESIRRIGFASGSDPPPDQFC